MSEDFANSGNSEQATHELVEAVTEAILDSDISGYPAWLSDPAYRATLRPTAMRHARVAVEYVLKPIQIVVDEQAEDEGLWFEAATAPEAYLQEQLRRLHAVVEGAL